MLFVVMNGIFDRQNNFYIEINFPYYYGNMFRTNMIIFKPTKLPNKFLKFG
jgi:hypothetical protein